MNKFLIGLLATSLSTTALAKDFGGNDEPEYDWARVVSVRPIVRIVQVSVPEEVCWNENVYHGSYDRTPDGWVVGSTVAGGIIGGAIGNRVGRGNGRPFTTAAGAFLGGALGYSAARSRPTMRVSSEEHCRTVNSYRSEERVDEYEVHYRYRGEIHETVLPYHPGNKIRVRVSVEPVAQ